MANRVDCSYDAVPAGRNKPYQNHYYALHALRIKLVDFTDGWQKVPFASSSRLETASG